MNKTLVCSVGLSLFALSIHLCEANPYNGLKSPFLFHRIQVEHQARIASGTNIKVTYGMDPTTGDMTRTYTAPNGDSISYNLVTDTYTVGNGQSVTETVNPDGSITYTGPYGEAVTVLPTGNSTYPSGTISGRHGGTFIFSYSPGWDTMSYTGPEGNQISYSYSYGQEGDTRTFTGPEGQTFYSQVDGDESIYEGPNGNTASLSTNSNGWVFTGPNEQTASLSTNGNGWVFTGPNEQTASITKTLGTSALGTPTTTWVYAGPNGQAYIQKVYDPTTNGYIWVYEGPDVDVGAFYSEDREPS